MADLSGLNKPQRQCVETLRGPLILLAGAGTGKTRVITYRIANMMAHGIPPSQIVALTFTNKAAREMRERVQLLCPGQAKELNVGTFHSFCLKILREHAQAAGLTQRFTIAPTSDQFDLIRKSLEEKGWAGHYKIEEISRAISHAKNQLWQADDIETHARPSMYNGLDVGVIAECFRVYERQLRLHHLIDFDDCIYRMVFLLKSNPDIKDKLSKRFLHFLVDEFQDTNLSQLEVISLLCERHRNICVVGDDDQSIYSWRGAMAEVMTQFEALFPERQLIKLEQNYRCSNVILNAANTVIKNNAARKDKVLWSNSQIQNEIILCVKEDELEEARSVAGRCLGLLGKNYRPNDIAILYRTNALARQLEVAFRELNLHYRVYGGQSFFERKEVRDVISYLRLIADPRHRLAFLRVVNLPTRGFGLKNLEKLEAQASEGRQSLFGALKAQLPQLTTKTKVSIQDFIENIERLGKKPLRSQSDVVSLVQEVISHFRLESEARASASSSDAGQRRVENIRRIPEWLGKFSQKYLEIHEGLELSELIDALSLDGTDTKEENESHDHISLMTIHAAKGLEFPCVFVYGLEDGIFPHKNSFEIPRGLDEERRLFYVAITRAKEHLFLSHPVFRNVGGGRSECEPSRFLEELPKDGLMSADLFAAKEQVGEAQQKERTRQRLSSLRSSLRSPSVSKGH